MSILLATVLAMSPAGPPGPNADAMRTALERSLPYVEARGRVWMAGEAPGQNDRCNSCHVVTFTAWALESAQRAGVDLSSDVVEEITAWSLDKIDGPDEMQQLIQTIGPSGDEDARTKLVGRLLDARDDDGSWPPMGQLTYQKRPIPETRGVTTMWAMLVLNQASRLDEVARDRALAVVDVVTEPVSAEWLALRMAVEPDEARRATRLGQVRAAQQADGSFGWLLDEPGDALATSIVVHVLQQSGVDRHDPTTTRAATFLTTTQRDDGTWPVNGTLEQHRHESTWTSEYWGAAWASVVLADLLPRPVRGDWHAVGGGTWEERDGVIIGRASRENAEHGLLVSDATYADFTATFEYRVLEGNSGFYFRAEESGDAVGVHGFQIEVDDVKPGGLYETAGRGWVIQHAPEIAAEWHRSGEWNAVRLEARGTRVRVWINEHLTADLDDPDGRRRGHLALQLHGGQDMHVAYRDIVIR